MATNTLKYLFEVEFTDDRPKYIQHKEDISLKFPPVKDENGVLQGKSSYTDIQEDVENGLIKRFTLVENTLLFPKKYTVDLTDGHFEIDGIPFDTEGKEPLPLNKENLRLIYYRTVKKYFTTPAVYRNPLEVTKVGKKVEITNSQNEVHRYTEVENMWAEKVKEMVEGKEQTVKYVYIKPVPPSSSTVYVIGWQYMLEARNYQQKILIQ